MAVLSGKNGTLHLSGAEVTPVSNWRMRLQGNLKEYGANDTEGWTDQVGGIEKADGSFLVRMDDASNCPVLTQDRYLVAFHVDGTGNNYYGGYIIIEDIEVEDDINEGEIEGYQITWKNSGPIVAYGILVGTSGSSSGS